MSLKKEPKSEIQVFRNNIDKFVNQLINIYPDDKDLKIYRDKVNAFASINPRGMVEYFMSNVQPYVAHIMERNEDFFLKDLNPDNVIENQKYRILFDKIKLLWEGGMTDDTKQTVWQYFTVFVTLGSIITKDQKSIDVINQYRSKKITL